MITISGYTTHEKENITNLCRLLGAHIQNSLSLKKNGELAANTHLICAKNSGPKYLAAVTWRMPVVGVDWLIDCCVTGSKASEEKYSVEAPRDMGELIRALAAIRQNEADSSLGGSEALKASYGLVARRSGLGATEQADVTAEVAGSWQARSFLGEDTAQQLSESRGNQSDTSLTAANESKKPRLDQSKSERFDGVFSCLNCCKQKLEFRVGIPYIFGFFTKKP